MELTGTLKGVLTRFRGFPDPFQRKFWNRFNLQIGFRILQRVPWTHEGVSDDFRRVFRSDQHRFFLGLRGYFRGFFRIDFSEVFRSISIYMKRRRFQKILGGSLGDFKWFSRTFQGVQGVQRSFRRCQLLKRRFKEIRGVSEGFQNRFRGILGLSRSFQIFLWASDFQGVSRELGGL